LSDVQSKLGIEAQDVAALGRTRTVGEVVDAMKIEIQNAGGPAPAANVSTPPAVVRTPMSIQPASTPVASGVSTGQAMSVVLEVLANKTGYETDMLETDMDLETELGVDSIKRVEILSDVQSQLGIEAQDIAALGRTRTVGDVIEAMKLEILNAGGSAAPAQAYTPSAPTQTPFHTPSTASANAAVEVVLEVLANKTGYETDMLEMDMDLETELGVDSIKRVEILSDVQAQLGIEAQDIAALGRTRTVGEVVDAMKAEIANAGGTVLSSSSARAGTISGLPSLTETSSVDLTYASILNLPTPDKLQLNTPSNRPIIIVDDNTSLTQEIAKKFGASAIVLSLKGSRNLHQLNQVVFPDMSEDSLKRALNTVQSRFGTPGGVVYQHRDNVDDATQFGWLMMLAKHASPFLQTKIANGRAFFITVARLNGNLGLGQHANISLRTSLQGAVLGLAKTLDHEWRDVFCRGIDLAKNMQDRLAAKSLFQETFCPNRLVREVGYNAQGVRCTTRALPLPLPAQSTVRRESMAVNSSDAFIVTGGGKGITPLCVSELAKSVNGGTYFLLGRSKIIPEPSFARGKENKKDLEKACLMHLKDEFKRGGAKPTPKKHKSLVNSILSSREINSSIKLIESNGGRAIYLPCDVTDTKKVGEVVRSASSNYGVSITGLIHASGVVWDKKIENKTLSDFNFVYGTKIVGLLNVLESLPLSNLRHLVMFSSLAGFHGNTGQSDYSMANDALNKIGHFVASAYPSCRVRALDFGPWDGGMVTPQLKAHFQSNGVQVIPRGEGAEIVAAMITTSEETQCLVGNWLSPPVECARSTNIVVRKVSTTANPFLESHKIHGKPVLPMTVACGNLATMAAQLNPGYSIDKVSDLRLFTGLTMDNNLDLQFNVVQKKNVNGQISVNVKMSNLKKNGRAAPAYGGVVTLSAKRKAPWRMSEPFSLDADNHNRTALYDGKVLFHGVHFQGIKKVLNCDNRRITTECTKLDLSAQDQGQFPIQNDFADHFAADIALQSFLVWVRTVRGAASLPNGCEEVEYFSAFPSSGKYYTTLIRDGGSAKDSVWKARMFMHDSSGQVFLKGKCAVTVSPNMVY
jgi:acyl carrier protein/NADP-dependent 3-hydroxy acid dehydrogenase YdfG